MATTSGEGSWKDLHSFLERGDAPILFMPGSSNRHAEAFFRIASQVVQERAQRAVFLTPYPGQLPHPLPESIHWTSFVDLGDLLGHVSAVVHHGGIGTVAQAFRSGVPQVVVPFAWDQFDNASRVVDLAGGVSGPCDRSDACPVAGMPAPHRGVGQDPAEIRLFPGHFAQRADEQALSMADRQGLGVEAVSASH
ncbi:MAG: glycosyltransferase [Burkholderiaceae bacterium]